MKKIISFILAAVMLLSLCACAPSGNDSTTGTTGNAGTNESTKPTEGGSSGQLLVGYGKADITPQESVPMNGYGSTEKRMSTGLKSYIYNIALAITDPQGNTAILIAADMGSIANSLAEDIRNKIADKCGIPADNVVISALHQHSTVDMGNSKVPSSARYRDEVFVPGAVKAAEAAMKNRAPATVQTASTKTTNMNFVRHYYMADGTVAGNNFGNMNQGFVKHAADVDNELRLVKFVREGQTTQDGKKAKDIILTNYQGHPIRGTSSSDTNIHSDMPGVYRDALEAKLGCQAIYFSGASGNAEFWSRISSENITADYKEQGKKLADIAAGLEGTYTDLELTAVKASKVSFTGECNHTEDHRVVDAERVWNEFQISGDTSIFKKNGFESRYHATAIISHEKLPARQSFNLFVLSFGDLAFVAAPYEMFCQSGMDVKNNSPFKTTVVASLANGSNSYMPTTVAWDYGCYEQYNSNYVRGTAEKLVEEFGKMLNDLHGQY